MDRPWLHKKFEGSGEERKAVFIIASHSGRSLIINDIYIYII